MPIDAETFKAQLTNAFLDAKPRRNSPLSRADQREAVSITVEWCLTHQSQYDPDIGSVGSWFGEHLRRVLRDTYRTQQRESVRRAQLNMEAIERNRSLTPSRRSDHPPRTHWSNIDHEIERLLRLPQHERSDCPSCWRCRWYDGLTPVAWAPTPFASAEVRAAVEATERRKIEIAGAHPEDYA